MKDIDRRTREIIREEGGMHHHESIKLPYLPEELGGSGMKSLEDTDKLTTVKVANYLNNSEDKRIKHARTLEMNEITQDRRSIFKQAVKYAKEYNITCSFDDAGTTITVSNVISSTNETKKITTPSPKAIKELLRTKMVEKYAKQLYKNTSVKQINIVFDFLGGYHEELRKGLSSITNTDKELSFLIERCQKWIIFQNANIVKFYEHV